MRTLLLLLLCACVGSVVGQESKDKLLKQAQYYYEYKNYKESLPYFIDLYKIDSTDVGVNFAIGECIYHTRYENSASIPYFEKAKGKRAESYFYLGKLYHETEKFDESLKNYDVYKKLGAGKFLPDSAVDYYIAQTLRAKAASKDRCVGKIKNLGPNINSKYPDYVPVLLYDESMMFFTSRRGGGDDAKDPNGNYFEDIYVSTRTDEGWGNARNLGFPVNTQTHEACIGVAPDLSSLFLYRTNDEGTGGGVYESKLNTTTKKWESPKYLKAGFNSKDPKVKTVCLIATPDSNSYFFVSNMPGGFGGMDIWRIVRFPDGEWSLPENVGPTINTPFDEDSPYFYPDNETMYFSSRGHETIGDFDVFKSTVDGETWGKPVHLGCPINTVRDDRFLSISPDGKRAYFSTQRGDSYGESDIYQVEIAETKPEYHIFKGQIIDSTTHLPVVGDVKLLESDQKKVVGVFKPNKLSGNFVLPLNANIEYVVEVKASGYKVLRFNLSVKPDEPEEMPIKTIMLTNEIQQKY